MLTNPNSNCLTTICSHLLERNVGSPLRERSASLWRSDTNTSVTATESAPLYVAVDEPDVPHYTRTAAETTLARTAAALGVDRPFLRWMRLLQPGEEARGKKVVARGKHLYGQAFKSARLIWIDAALPLDMVRRAIRHELLHCAVPEASEEEARAFGLKRRLRRNQFDFYS